MLTLFTCKMYGYMYIKYVQRWSNWVLGQLSLDVLSRLQNIHCTLQWNPVNLTAIGDQNLGTGKWLDWAAFSSGQNTYMYIKTHKCLLEAAIWRGVIPCLSLSFPKINSVLHPNRESTHSNDPYSAARWSGILSLMSRLSNKELSSSIRIFRIWWKKKRKNYHW